MGSFVMSHDQTICLDRALFGSFLPVVERGGHHIGMGSFVMSHDQTTCLDRALFGSFLPVVEREDITSAWGPL